jgi:hypothetical protein
VQYCRDGESDCVIRKKKRFHQVSFNQIWSFYITGLELHNASQRESSHFSVWKFSRCQAARV